MFWSPRAGALVVSFFLAASPGAASAASAHITFTLNVQDFSYPDRSANLVRRVVSLHEQRQVPVDVYLTTTMVDLFEAQAPDLLTKLRTSPWVAVSYHVRPPSPFYNGYDWLGLSRLPPDQQAAKILSYERHGLDLTTGQPTTASGGFSHLTDLVGAAPWVASALPDAELRASVNGVFGELGARFTLVHGRSVNLGDTLDGLYLKPEHVDLKLFEHVGEAAATVLETAVSEAGAAPGGRAPYFVGVKMHDNDFFAEKSAWVTVYGSSKRPPWNPSLRASLLSQERQDAVWSLYEAAVGHVAAESPRLTAISAPGILRMISGGTTASPTVLLVSGTMHIETRPESWPDPDAFVAFLGRATAAGKSSSQPGMRWSIGADIGWLEREPRAGEVIRATEALGVEWDVHAHELSDRARCAEAITRLGGHPTRVASGLLTSELDSLRPPLTSPGGTVWQALSLWGLSIRPNHGPGADDLAYGLWRPLSGASFQTHDPNGTLIAVGGGDKTLAGTESAAAAVQSTAGLPPVLSASIWVTPATLLVEGGNDGIDAIEAWAARLAANPAVRWATISGTADAWIAAGGVPSRMESVAAPAALPYSWLLPSSAHLSGAGGAFYTTDLTIANPGTTEARFALKFLGHETDGRVGIERSFSLAAGKSVAYQDVLGSVFSLASDYGALRIASDVPELIAVSQTSTPGGGGTFGQSVPVVGVSELIAYGAARSIVGVREDGAFRTNLVLVNATEASLDVDVSLVSEGGTVLASKRYALSPLGMRQVTRVARDLGVTTPVSGMRLVLATPTAGGSFAAYASAIDETTNDPRTLVPR